MIMVRKIWHFYGDSSVPSVLCGENVEITPEMLVALCEQYDVQITHSNDALIMGLDVVGGRFRQR